MLFENLAPLPSKIPNDFYSIRVQSYHNDNHQKKTGK
jgi:hypothetical protein